MRRARLAGPGVADARYGRLRRRRSVDAGSRHRTRLDAAKALVERGAEIDPVENRYGGTPLGGASHCLHREVMDLLAPRSRDVWNLTYNGYLDRLREVLAENPERARVDWD